MKSSQHPFIPRRRRRPWSRILAVVILVGIGFLGWTAYQRLTAPYRPHEIGGNRPTARPTPVDNHLAVAEPTVVMMVPLSGFFAEEGRMMAMGARLAWNQQQALGVKGRLRIVDGAEDLEQLKKVAEELAADPNVVVAVAHLPERVLIRIVGLFEKSGPALLMPALTHENLYRYRWVFPLLDSDRQEGLWASQIAARLTGSGRIAVVASADQYGQLLAEKFREGCRNQGLACASVVTDDRWPLSRAVAQVLEQRPDLVWIAGLPRWGAKIVSLLVRRGFSGKILAPRSYGWLHPVDLFGNNSGHLLILRPAVLEEKTPGPAVDFKTRFERSFWRRPDILAALAYDTLNWIGKCLKRPPVNRDLFRHRFSCYRSRQHAYQGVTGSFYFDQDGSLHHSLVAAVYRDGRFVAYDGS